MGNKRTACISIAARTGDVRAARSVVVRALKEAGVRYDSSNYISAADLSALAGFPTPPRYVIEMTDREMKAYLAAAERIALAEGWDAAPHDCYHD